MKLTNEIKIITVICFVTIAVVGVVIFSFSGTPATPRESSSTIPKDQIITENGLHWHPTLAIYIEGEKQEIPANIGLGAEHLSIHTHEDANEGVIHMEFSEQVLREDTRLGNFFITWGKPFSKSQIFDKKNTGDKKVTMTVNGKVNNEYEKYQMKDGNEIIIRYE